MHELRKPRRIEALAGLRAQILMALAGLLLLAFLPLFFAVARLTERSITETQAEGARSLGRLMAAQIAERKHARSVVDESAELSRTLSRSVDLAGALAAVVFSEDGKVLASAGVEGARVAERVPPRPFREAIHTSRRGTLDVVVPGVDYAVVVRMPLDDSVGPQLSRLFALYTAVFAVALFVFAYFALTRLIVKPVEALAHAADRVATGAPKLEIPQVGARELAELGASLRAMTERLRTNEEDLKSQVDALERASRNLLDTRSQLEGSERLASVGRLAAGVAHEIGNPITAIIGLQDLMLDGGLPQETNQDFLARMRKETERVNEIVKDLLSYARTSTAEEQNAATEAGDVASAIEQVVALVKPQKGMKELDLHVDASEGLPSVAMPTRKVSQVLLNVLLNAKDALVPAQGPKRGSRIVLRVRASESAVLIEVEDDGPGIAPELADKIFEPFFTTKDVGSGTGLGLAVCRGLVEASGGTIRVDASYRDGARIVVSLPRATR